LCRRGRRPSGRLHSFFHRRTGAGDGGEMVRRARRPHAGRGRRNRARRRSRLGAVARRRILSAPLCSAAAERRRLVAPAAAGSGRPARFREPRGVRLAQLAEPLVKLLPPETAHRLAVFGMKIAPPRPRDPRLVVAALGLKFPNPLGLAAGFDKNAEVPGAMLRLGFGYVEVGTLTPRPQAGNARPRLFRLPKDGAVINRFGFNNEGYERARTRLERRPAGLIGVNVGANKDAADRIADYVLGVKTFAPFADYVAINISSPNTPGLRDLQRRDALDELVARVAAARDETEPRQPLVVKIAPDLDDHGLDDIVAVALARGIDGLIVSNTTVARPASLRSPHRGESGGLSGRPLFEPSTRLLARAYLAFGGAMPLIGCGGVEDAATAIAKIEAGTSLVQLYTSLALKGIRVIDGILNGLERAVAERGVTGI